MKPLSLNMKSRISAQFQPVTLTTLANLPTRFRVDPFVNVPANRAVPANSEMTLIRQSLEHLIDQGISEDDGLSILRDWESQKTGILAHIEYSDIYDNEMEAIDETLN